MCSRRLSWGRKNQLSAKISGLIWEVGPDDRPLRFVLLAIADNSGDDGYAYPGVDLLCSKTLFEKRHVLRALQQLEKDGWLRIERKAIAGKGNAYYIDVEKLETLKDEARSRSKKKASEPLISGDTKSRDISDSGDIYDKSQVTSATGSGDIYDIPPHPLLGEPSGTVKGTKAQAGDFCPPEWVPADLWEAWLEMRKKIRKPATRKAMELAVGHLLKLRNAGHSPAAVLEQSILNSWQGLFEPKSSLFPETKPKSSLDGMTFANGRPN